jgi:hypothetical protein
MYDMSNTGITSQTGDLREATAPRPRPTLLQKLAWFYAGLFLFVVSLGYIPGFTDDQGLLFGLFSIQLRDDLLHLASGIWAAVAAWWSGRASLRYFQLFGAVYLLDGVVGLLFGQAFLDAGIFLCGITSLNPWANFAANLPHLLIGGFAAYAGFVLGRRHGRG